MKNKKTYSEIMKSHRTYLNRKKENVTVQDIYIQMVIDAAIFKRKKALLDEKINAALDSNNKEEFLKLSKEYRQLVKPSVSNM